MKYQAPTERPYESNLTVKLMYDTVDRLIEQHIGPTDYERVRQIHGTQPNTKLWDKPEIRDKLEEFIQSYFFTDLNPPEGFEETLNRGIKYMTDNLNDYMPDLVQRCGSKDEAKKQVAGVFKQLEKRLFQINEELKKIDSVDGNNLVKDNVRDAFGQLLGGEYPRIGFLMRRLEKY